MKLKKTAEWLGISVASFAVLLFVWLWASTYHPGLLEDMEVFCSTDAPVLEAGQTIKIMSWNVQYMAGKNYVFFYDRLDGSGPDERPSSKDIAKTFLEVTRIIKAENPDIILLQELDDGAKRTDYEDQLKRLLTLLPNDYACQTSAFYWKAAFVPHPRIMGSVGMKLSILSKYKMTKAERLQLELIPADPLTRQFNFKRAVLKAYYPVKNSKKELVVMTTHLDAFAQGTRTMELQARQVKSMLDDLDRDGNSWILGGDCNLLAPGKSYDRLVDEEKKYFNPRTELAPIIETWQSVPSMEDINGDGYRQWFTQFPNGSRSKGPDRTIDYLFLSVDIKIKNKYVRQQDTLAISDHLPVVAEIVVQ
jgi:endonuclease/exonuclease/phosphatase family metal-dependent hydrolase